MVSRLTVLLAAWMLLQGCTLDRSGLLPDGPGASTAAAGGFGGSGGMGAVGGSAHGGGGNGGASDGGGGSGGGPLDGFARRKAITLNPNQIQAGNGNLLDFPLLISLTDADMAAYAQPDGDDIVFTAADGHTILSRDLELWDGASGRLVCWVRLPQLSPSNNTLYVYYGNPNSLTPLASSTWSAAHALVAHLDDDPGPGNAGDIGDATSNQRHGTAASGMSAGDLREGKIGLGTFFDGTDDYVAFADYDFGASFTVSGWVQPDNLSGLHTLLSNAASGDITNGFRIFVNTFNTTDGRVVFEAGNGSQVDRALSNPGVVSVVDTWYHLVVAVDRTAGSAAIYVDGVDVTADASTLTNFAAQAPFRFGIMQDNLHEWSGMLDELRVETGLRGPDWIATTFSSQSRPDLFVSLDPAEPLP